MPSASIFDIEGAEYHVMIEGFDLINGSFLEMAHRFPVQLFLSRYSVSQFQSSPASPTTHFDPDP
jgi:hypothetical protein